MDKTILALGALYICYVIFRPRSLLWRTLYWMMINGYLFPKAMRRDMERNLGRIDRENKKLDEIIDNRSI